MIRIPEIKLSLDTDEIMLKKEISKKLNISEEAVLSYRIFKKSIDARKKNQIHFVYVVDVEVKNEETILKKFAKKGVLKTPELKFEYKNVAPEKFTRPVVVGFGPAGLFAGLILAQAGFKPIILEIGRAHV